MLRILLNAYLRNSPSCVWIWNYFDDAAHVRAVTPVHVQGSVVVSYPETTRPHNQSTVAENRDSATQRDVLISSTWEPPKQTTKQHQKNVSENLFSAYAEMAISRLREVIQFTKLLFVTNLVSKRVFGHEIRNDGRRGPTRPNDAVDQYVAAASDGFVNECDYGGEMNFEVFPWCITNFDQ